jgi:hypothetical protein
VVSFIGGGNQSTRRSWWSVLLVEETRVPGDLPQVTDKLYHNKMLYWLILSWAGFELTMLVVIGTDYIGSYKSNYHTIATTTTPLFQYVYQCNIHQLIYNKNSHPSKDLYRHNLDLVNHDDISVRSKLIVQRFWLDNFEIRIGKSF